MITTAEGVHIYEPSDVVNIELLRQSRYFLVRNGGADDPAKCKRCGAIHPYLTRFCIEQPYRGLLNALYAYVRISNNADVQRKIAALNSFPQLHAHHPYTHHQVKPQEGEEVIAYELGVAEPIDEARALRYARALQLRRVPPPYILEGQ